MALELHFKNKCPICRKTMRFKAFIGSGNVQGLECVKCVLILSASAFIKLDEVMFSYRIRVLPEEVF